MKVRGWQLIGTAYISCRFHFGPSSGIRTGLILSLETVPQNATVGPLKEKKAKSRPSAEHLHPPPSRPLSPPRIPLPERPCSHGIMSSNKRRADTYLTKEPQRNRPDEDIDRDRDAIDPVQRASAEVMATRKYRPQHLLIDNFHFGLFRWSGLTCC